MHMTNLGVNKHMATVEPSLVSSGVKMVMVGIRVKGRQGGKRVYSDSSLSLFIPIVISLVVHDIHTYIHTYAHTYIHTYM